MVRRKPERQQALVKPTAVEISRDYAALVAAIAQAHEQGQRQAVQAVNMALTLRNWLVGYHIAAVVPH